MVTLANSEDPDEMKLNAAFYQALYCLLRLKQHSRTEIPGSGVVLDCIDS